MRKSSLAPETIVERITQFVAEAREPMLAESGEEPYALTEGNYRLDSRNGWAAIEVWSEGRNLSRRVIEARERGRGRIELIIERFGKRRGVLSLYDRAEPRNHSAVLQSDRDVFLEEIRRMVRRQFPGWTLAELTNGADLEHTLSPSYPRGLVRKGHSAWAVLGAPRDAANSDGAITFGLIWLDYLRRLERRHVVEGLALFVPAGLQIATCLRLQYLNQAARYAVFVFSEEGFEHRIDPRDHGNLQTRIEACPATVASALVPPEADTIENLADVEAVTLSDGNRSYRVRGLEIARTAGGRLLAGIDRKRPVSGAAVERMAELAREVALRRSPDTQDRQNPLFARNPEAWLECQVRSAIHDIDATLHPTPVYRQTPTIAGIERSVLDLLAVGRDGRLTVLEIKASADPHLPVQALDYWMRVRFHAAAGDFLSKGYFPGISLRPDPPRLLLVAPALEFHPSTEAILHFFSTQVPVERIGLATDWRRGLKVVFRTRGSDSPGISVAPSL